MSIQNPKSLATFRESSLGYPCFSAHRGLKPASFMHHSESHVSCKLEWSIHNLEFQLWCSASSSGPTFWYPCPLVSDWPVFLTDLRSFPHRKNIMCSYTNTFFIYTRQIYNKTSCTKKPYIRLIMNYMFARNLTKKWLSPPSPPGNVIPIRPWSPSVSGPRLSTSSATPSLKGHLFAPLWAALQQSAAVEWRVEDVTIVQVPVTKHWVWGFIEDSRIPMLWHKSLPGHNIDWKHSTNPHKISYRSCWSTEFLIKVPLLSFLGSTATRVNT